MSSPPSNSLQGMSRFVLLLSKLTFGLIPIHLQVDRVLAGEFPHAQLECLDHRHLLDKKSIGPAFGLRLELDWSIDKGLYIVRDHRPVTLPGTLLVCVLPALLAFGLLLGVRTFVRRGQRKEGKVGT